MNSKRRKIIKDIIDLLSIAANKLEDVVYDEQNAYDNMPESLQSSERGEDMYDCIGNLENSYDKLDDVVSTLEEYIN